MMLLCVCGLATSTVAQDLVNAPVQTHEYARQQNIATEGDMAPPPLGPYQVDPDSKSSNIYNEMHETMPYKRHPEQYGGDFASRYPDGQGYNPSSVPYGQGYNPSPMPAPDGYYPQYGETYGNQYPPPYPGYPQYSQPRYGYPHGPQQ